MYVETPCWSLGECVDLSDKLRSSSVENVGLASNELVDGSVWSVNEELDVGVDDSMSVFQELSRNDFVEFKDVVGFDGSERWGGKGRVRGRRESGTIRVYRKVRNGRGRRGCGVGKGVFKVEGELCRKRTQLFDREF